MKITLILLIIFLLPALSHSNETPDVDHLKLIRNKYLDLQFYSSTGELRNHNYQNGTLVQKRTITFEIKLKKPNKLLISCYKPDGLFSGAIWGEKNTYYYYNNQNRDLHQFSTVQNALIEGIGNCGAAPYRIATFFLEEFKDKKNWLSTLKNQQLTESNPEVIKGKYNFKKTTINYRIQKDTKSNLITEYSSSAEYSNSSKEKSASLIKVRDKIIKNKEKYIQLYKDRGIENPEKKFNSEIEDLNRSIQKVKNENESASINLAKEKAIFNKINTTQIPEEHFIFKAPGNVNYRGASSDNFLK